MNVPLKNRIVVAVVLALIVAAQCYPAKTKKGGANRKRTVSRHKGHGKSNTKKDSVNQRDMATMMHPGKLDMSDDREMDSFQDYNKAFINNEMAAESTLLANQGIDDDSALKISNMAAMPGGMEDHPSSKKGMGGRIKGNPIPLGKPNVAGFSPDEYLMDANSWPEYRIKDSDYNNKNYRVFPQGPGYPGSYMGGAMPYGQTAAAGMEGPYGDGNYGFPPAGQMHMVSDEQEQTREQEQEQDQGDAPSYQDEGTPIAMPPDTGRIGKAKHHRKLKNAAGESYGDEVRPSQANAGGSGSGHADASGSGASSHDATKANSVMQDQTKTGQVSVDTKPDGTVITAKTADSSPAGQTKTESKTQENTSPDQKSSNTENSDSKATSGQANPTAKRKGEGAGEAPHSTLGEFAKFLKSKGITLTINKESKDAEPNKPHPGKENASPVSAQQQQADSPAAQSGPSSILPSTGQPTSDSAGNPTINISPETNDGQQVQDQPLHTGVMRWRNMAPQESQLGELFLRHKTKPHH